MHELDRASNFLATLPDSVYYATLGADVAWNVRGVMAEAQAFANVHSLTMPGSESEPSAEG